MVFLLWPVKPDLSQGKVKGDRSNLVSGHAWATAKLNCASLQAEFVVLSVSSCNCLQGRLAHITDSINSQQWRRPAWTCCCTWGNAPWINSYVCLPQGNYPAKGCCLTSVMLSGCTQCSCTSTCVLSIACVGSHTFLSIWDLIWGSHILMTVL